MSSLGFVSRMANWLRGHPEADTSPFETSEQSGEHPPASEPAEQVALLKRSPAPADVDRARRSQAVMQELMVRFTGATDALADIRGGLAGLEETFEELPEVVRAQTRFLAAISDRLQAQEVHLRELSGILRDLPASATAQMRTLEQTNQLLNRGEQAIGPLTGGFHRLANTMQGLNESSRRHLMSLGMLTERHERYLKEQREAFRQHNRLVIAILAVTGILGVGGVILAVCALLT